MGWYNLEKFKDNPVEFEPALKLPIKAKLTNANELKDWARKVKQRDGYKCTKCGNSNDLHSHHIIHKAKDRKLQYELSNGITLCAM